LKTPKFESRNSKWFDKLTILSKVEGQIQNTNVSMTQTRGVSRLGFWISVIRACFGFRISIFGFNNANSQN